MVFTNKITYMEILLLLHGSFSFAFAQKIPFTCTSVTAKNCPFYFLSGSQAIAWQSSYISLLVPAFYIHDSRPHIKFQNI
jgi:hypothetical protein